MARAKKAVSGLINPVFQPKQTDLLIKILQSRATWLGFGGSRGSAKSGAIRRIILALANARNAERFAGRKVLVFRRKFNPDLWENHIQMFFREWPVIRHWYNTQTKEITFPNNFVVKFGYAEHEGDIEDFQGQEDWIH